MIAEKMERTECKQDTILVVDKTGFSDWHGGNEKIREQKWHHGFGSRMLKYGLPQWLNGKESAFSAGDAGLIPGSGRSPGRGQSTGMQKVGYTWAHMHRCSNMNQFYVLYRFEKEPKLKVR